MLPYPSPTTLNRAIMPRARPQGGFNGLFRRKSIGDFGGAPERVNLHALPRGALPPGHDPDRRRVRAAQADRPPIRAPTLQGPSLGKRAGGPAFKCARRAAFGQHQHGCRIRVSGPSGQVAQPAGAAHEQAAGIVRRADMHMNIGDDGHDQFEAPGPSSNSRASAAFNSSIPSPVSAQQGSGVTPVREMNSLR